MLPYENLYLQVDLAEGTAVSGKDDGDGAQIQQAADALDFADEDELIEDASAPAAAVPASYAAVGAALATGGEAEDEDYDFDEEEPAPPPAAHPAAAPAPATTAAPPPQQPAVVIRGDPTSQANIALSRGIQLPMLSRDAQGDAVLAFTDLFRSVSKQSSTAAQQREKRRVRFSDATITSLSPQKQPTVPVQAPEVDQGLLLLQSGSEQLAKMGVDVILQKEQPRDHRVGLQILEDLEEEQMGRRTQQQEVAAPAAVAGAEKPSAAIAAATNPSAAAAKAVDTAAGTFSLLPTQQHTRTTPTTTTSTSTTGPSFAVLPPCVFDPVIQQIWELKINKNSANGSLLDRGVNDTSSEHETDDEDEDGRQQVVTDGAAARQHVAVATALAGGGDVEMAANGGEDNHHGDAMENDESEEEEEEEEEESEEVALTRKLAAEMKAAREHVTAWGNSTNNGSDAVHDAPDPEDVVNMVHAAPLLRYSNPLKALFPRQPTVVAVPAAPSATAAAAGDEAGTSAAAVAPSEGQQPSAPQQQPGVAAAAAAPTAHAAAIPEVEEEEDLPEEDTPALPVLAASRAPTWESDVILEGGSAAAARLQSLPLTLDLNDPGLVLHNVSKKAERNNPEFKNLVNTSTATVMPYQKRAIITVAKGIDATNEAIVELAKINISRDTDYFAQPKRRAGSGGVRAVHHAKPAAELVTIPLTLDTKEMALYHRPRGFWWPIEAAKGTRNPQYPQHATVWIETLAGGSKSTRGVSLATMSPAQMWEHVYSRPGWKRRNNDGKCPLPLFLVPGTPRPTVIPPEVKLNRSGIPMRGRETMEIVAAYREVELRPTSEVDSIQHESNSALLRPPMAFTSVPQLRAATPGRVVLVEYLQDSPLLLNRPGMGLRLATYYRRKGAGDTGHQRIRNAAAEAGQRWRVGAMNPINEDDESPFLGELGPGSAQLSVETGLFTAPAAPHAPLDSDFLFTRSPSGYMSVREITGAVASGQQLPLHRIPVPGSRDLKDLEERLIYVHVYRVLRDRKIKEERRLKKQEQNPPPPGQFLAEQVPVISLKELSTLFPNRPQTALRLFIKDVCGLHLWYKDRTGDEFFRVAEGARMPSEPELRRKCTPEDACVLEACRVAEYRMQQSGLLKAVKFNYGNVAADKLRLAAEMLPPDEVTQAAAKAVEAQYITAAWNLTDAFMSSFREGRATMRLLGPGDPTGRGVGYSFVRDVRHKGTGNDDPTKAMNKQRSGKVQGTDADLRRMTTEQAKKKLIDFGLDAAEIDPLGRWVRIDLVRQLANASAADGSVAGIAKYVRHQKTTLIELQKRYRERAQEIFDRQMAVLNDSAAEELGDQAALEAELEAELAAEEREDEGGDPSPIKKKKGSGRDSSPAPEDEARQLEEMRAAGLLGSSPGGNAASAAGADGAGPSTSAAAAAAGTASAADASGVSGPLIPGQTRRIRREVLARSNERGPFEKIHEVIYAGRDRPFLLASLYQKEGQVITGPWGFGSRVINYSRGEKRLNYNASRGRGVGRGRGRGGGRGSGGGGGPGSRGGRGSRGGGRGSRGGRGGGSVVDYDRYDGLDPSAMNVGHRSSRRANAAKRTKEDIYVQGDGIEDYEDIDSEIEEDDEEYDAYVDEMEEQGIIIVKPKQQKKPAAPRAPRQPKPVELDAEGNPIPKKPKQPKKEKAPLTEEQLEKQRQRQQREPSPQFISGREFDEFLRAEGALDDDDGTAEVIKQRPNRVRGTGIVGLAVTAEPVNDVAPVEWDPYAPLGGGTAAGITRTSTITSRPAPVYHQQQQWSGDEDYIDEGDDDDDEEYVGEGRRKKRPGTGGGGGGRSRTTRGGNRGARSVAPVPQPTRASSRSAAVSKKRGKYDDVTDDEEFDEDYASDMTDSPRNRRSGGGGGGGGKKKSKTSGGYTAAYTVAAPRAAPRASGLVAAAKALGAVFVRILDKMKEEGEEYRRTAGKTALTYFSIFGDPVSLTSLPDYRDKVPENKFMNLKKIRYKAMKGDYYNVESVMNDFIQIRENAKAYNNEITGGRYKYPACIAYAEGIVTYVEEKLAWPENEHAINLALDQIAAASSGGGDGGGVEDFIVAFDPSANYSLEQFPASDPTAAAAGGGGVVAEVEWILCEKCKAWRILEEGIDPGGYFECSLKGGFTCATPLEPGASYETEET
jgi:Protein of unknown function (DUF3591)/Bromodomain